MSFNLIQRLKVFDARFCHREEMRKPDFAEVLEGDNLFFCKVAIVVVTFIKMGLSQRCFPFNASTPLVFKKNRHPLRSFPAVQPVNSTND